MHAEKEDSFAFLVNIICAGNIYVRRGHERVPEPIVTGDVITQV